MNILQCPKCKSDDLALNIEYEDEREVRTGSLTCISCEGRYSIAHGVVELLPEILDEHTWRERQERDKKVRDWEVERQRPYINDMPECPWCYPSIAANVEQGLRQLTLAGKLVLDIGAATCWSTRMMSEGSAMAVALDISTSMLRDGEAQFGAGVYFDRIAATMNELPFHDRVFDAVFASATIHHSDDIRRTFSEIRRILKPCGLAVLVNEPVLGLLRRASDFGCEDIEQGMNEHVYRLRGYLRAAGAAGLKADGLFPASLTRQLLGDIPAPDTDLMKLAKFGWRMTPRFLQRLSLPVGHILVGLPLVLVVKRPIDLS